MADDLDRAQQESELMLSIQLRQRKPALPVTGHCHWCETQLTAGSQALFCDTDCRDDHEQFRQKTNGGF